MAAEIAEQPAVWLRLLHEAESGVNGVARVIGERRPRFVLLAARGSSDHAALYAKYLVEVLLGLPAGLVSPSTLTIYGARQDLREVLLLGVSQSGASPDLVRTVEVARAQGSTTVAVTNDPQSPLAEAAEMHLDVAAGVERSVAATKSYTAQLLALYMLVSRLAGRSHEDAQRLPAWGAAVLAAQAQVAALADRYRTVDRMVVTARGYSYPTAREAALKLMETSYISAQAFSGADLLHGPMALIDRRVPVIVIAGPGSGDAMRPIVEKLHKTRADVLCVGTAGPAGDGEPSISLPHGLPEELSPLVEILPLQHLALHVALARGENPDSPRRLTKVTHTL